MESRYCPKCGKVNTTGSRFCQHCGSMLAASEKDPSGAALSPDSPAYQQRQHTQRPSSRSTPVRSATSMRKYPHDDIGQMGSGGFSAVDIWGPFAGYGERGRHVSWLLDNLGSRAEELRATVTQRFAERTIPNAHLDPQRLTGKGIVVERRPYYLIKRSIATVGLYIARFGQDLYISQVTYAKGAINPLRVAILGIMIVFQLYILFGYSASVESAIGSVSLLGGYSGSDTDALTSLVCCIGPLGFVNTILLIMVAFHMLYKFLTDKDLLMILRTPPNEFQYDDIVALEKAVEETVRNSMDKIGIDPTLLTPSKEYGPKRRLI